MPKNLAISSCVISDAAGVPIGPGVPDVAGGVIMQLDVWARFALAATRN